MVVLGAVIISLGCMFLGYCLLHFRCELKRTRDIEIPGRTVVLEMPRATPFVSARTLIPWGTVRLAAMSSWGTRTR